MRALAVIVVLALAVTLAGAWLSGRRGAHELRPSSIPVAPVFAESGADSPGTELVAARREEPVRAEAVTAPEVQPGPDPDAVPTVPAVQGRVVDVRDGVASPAVGVTVAVDSRGSREERHAAGTTDDDGRFEVPLLDGFIGNRAFRVRVEGDHAFRSARETVGLAEGQSVSRDVELRRTAFGMLEGRVVDISGAPLADVSISLACGRGRDPLRRISAEDGTFRVEETSTLSRGVEVALPGHRMYRSNGVREHKDGGWHPLEIVMCPVASLVVRVSDDQGEPVEQATVTLGIASAERVSVADGAVWGDGWKRYGSRDRSPATETEASGEARFDDVWSECRLEVQYARVTYTTEHDGVLATDGSGARPLVLRPGEVRSVELRLPAVHTRAELAVEVTVHSHDGSPANRAEVRVYALDAAGSVVSSVRGRRNTDGIYACAVPVPPPGGRVRAAAAKRLYRVHSARGEPVGVVSAPADSARDGRLRLEVTMGPTLALAGRIVDVEGTPLNGWIRVEREDYSPPGPIDQLNLSGSDSVRDGEFRMHGLDPGMYALHFHERRAGGSCPHVFRDLPAGSEDLELLVETPADVVLRVEVDAGGLTVARSIAVLDVRDSSGAEPVAGPTVHDLRRPVEWPAQITLGPTGNVGEVFMRQANEPDAHVWEGLRPGRYVVGFVAWDEAGRTFYPVLSEPLDLGSGEHRFVAHLSPAAAFHGRVLGAPEADLAIALTDGAGRRVSLFPNGKGSTDVVPLDGRNQFRVSVAPAGEFTLVVGEAAELREGRTIGSVAVSLAGGEDREIEVDLH